MASERRGGYQGRLPLDRGGDHLGFRSGIIENTNGDRGDHGCGPSEAQAAAGKAVPSGKRCEEGAERLLNDQWADVHRMAEAGGLTAAPRS